MPAILSENGFMDNKREAILMTNPHFQLEVAQEHAKGICKYFDVKYVPAKESTNSNLAEMLATRRKSPATNKLLQTFAKKRFNIDVKLQVALLDETEFNAVAAELAVYYVKKDN